MARTRRCRTPARSSTRSKLPPEGGDTLFADTYAAFEALAADVREAIVGRRACFSRVRLHQVHYPQLPPLTEEDKQKRPDVWHPIARRHPKSGWTSLYIGRWACEIEDMSGPDGAALIEYLQDFAMRPEFVYRHRWRAGRRGALGQPLRAALRHAFRRHEVPAPHAPHDARRRSAAHGRRAGIS